MNKKVLVVGLATILLLIYGSQFLLSSVFYATAYQGPKAYYYGVRVNGVVYTNTAKHQASECSFDTDMHFDIDDATSGMCDIVGEMTSVFIPESTVYAPEYARELIEGKEPPEQPKKYTWEVVDSEGNIHAYTMLEATLYWAFSISAEWDSGPGMSWSDETNNRRYHNTEIWFMFDLTNKPYFETQPDNLYIAVAKIKLVEVKTFGYNHKGKEVTSTQNLRFTPMSPGSIRPVYLTPFGQTQLPQNVDETIEDTANNRQMLNPYYFRDAVYTYITLEDFGTVEWFEGLGWGAKGDALTMVFEIKVFVVGEWVVRDYDELPDDYGRTPRLVRPPSGNFIQAILDALEALFRSPWTWLGVGVWLLVAVAAVFTIALVYFMGPPKWVGKKEGKRKWG